ncbi:MAG: hypothetical protein ABSF45_01715 [Terriglobia bacterium]|jgi:hypothetical protein
MQVGDTKLKRLEARHPGLVQKVDAMFDAFATIKAVEAMLQAEYGERVGHSAICNYKRRSWKVRRKRDQAARAAMTAYQELLSEGRN